MNERICEVSRSVIAEFGTPELLERLEGALEERGLTQPKAKRPKHERQPRRRRWSIYPLEELGSAIKAQAKAEGISCDKLICRMLAERFERSP